MADYLDDGYDTADPDIASVIDDVALWSAPFGMKLLDVVEMKPGITMLDIGSGTGFPLIELSQRLDGASRAYGVDPWPEAVDRTRHKIATWRLRNVEAVEACAEALPFGDGFFDLAVSNNGINNVTDDEAAMGEIARVCKPGAQLVATVNLPDTMREFYDVFRRVLVDSGMNDAAERLDAHISAKRKPLSYTKDLLSRHGFAVRRVHEDAFRWRYVDGTTFLSHFTIKLAFLPSWRAVVDASRAAAVFAELEAELNAMSRAAGELRVTIPWVCIDARRG